MAWDDELPIILRYMIDDVSDTPKYSDDRLATMISLAAIFTQQENSFSREFVIDVTEPSISPDPTDSATRDNVFIALTTLKAACLLARAELKTISGQSVSIQSGRDRIDLTGNLRGKQQVATAFCQEYQDARWEFQLNTSIGIGQAIVGPGNVGFGASSYGFLTSDNSSFYRAYRNFLNV
jgi:hypothetical protein